MFVLPYELCIITQSEIKQAWSYQPVCYFIIIHAIEMPVIIQS